MSARLPPDLRADELLDEENPFSASRVRPGMLEYQFPPGVDAAALVARFEAVGRQGQIVGPHGSGKSTLLATLLAEFARRGSPTVVVTLHDRQRRMPPGFFADAETLGPQGIVVVDGYEQLNWWSRRRLAWFCRRRGLGLLLTTHQPVQSPAVWSMVVEPAVIVPLVQQLFAAHGLAIAADDVRSRLEKHSGNVRELFMELYDRFEDLANHRSE